MKVLLFSGGLDSTALAHWLQPDRLLFVDYGQTSAQGELRAANKIAQELGIPFEARSADCSAFGAGDMVGGPSLSDTASEFWPYRNQLLITLAAMAFAESDPLSIIIGTVKSDEIHPDGRSTFLSAIQSVLAAQANTTVEAPAKHLTPLELQLRARVPISILAWAFSCHRTSDACGQCRGCTKHFETLVQLADSG
jgi:7-cyano-7-deazaguanine synthase